MKTYKILNVNVISENRSVVIDNVIATIDKKEYSKKNIAFANANLLNEIYENKLNEKLKNFDIYNDGVGLSIALYMKYGDRFKENLNGTDLLPILISKLRKDARIALIGATQDVNESMCSKLKNIGFQNIIGINGFNESQIIARNLRDKKFDLIMVAMGNPKQELFIEQTLKRVEYKVAIGVGAFFDFYTNNVRRAPVWMREIRMEWVYRLMYEPKRLARRYIIGNPLFLYRVLTNE